MTSHSGKTCLGFRFHSCVCTCERACVYVAACVRQMAPACGGAFSTLAQAQGGYLGFLGADVLVALVGEPNGRALDPFPAEGRATSLHGSACGLQGPGSWATPPGEALREPGSG